MHSGPQATTSERMRQISLEQIAATVSEFPGPGCVKGNGRQVSMSLARHVGRWTYPKVRRFYDGAIARG
jgi:hypothetical protein